MTRRDCTLLMFGLAGGARLAAQAGDGTGPAAGEKIPEFTALDQYGQRRDFASLSGPNGLLLLFHRSADWCPYCKGQLAQLERKREALASRGVNLAAVSYDSVEILRHFAGRAGIGYPLLSDPDSKIIRDFGILNTSVAADHPFYGIPNPGEYLVAPDGTVRSKFFEEAFQDRFTAGRILVTEFGADAGGARRTTETAHLKATTWASDEVVRGGNRLALVVDLELPPKMHVYAPGVEGYIAIDWSMDDRPGAVAEPVAYPEPQVLELAAIGEAVPVYEGSFRFTRDVHIGQPDKVASSLDGFGGVTLRGKLRYQACDDKVCYLPQTVPLEWTLAFEQHDRTRAPEELQRKRPAARRR